MGLGVAAVEGEVAVDTVGDEAVDVEPGFILRWGIGLTLDVVSSWEVSACRRVVVSRRSSRRGSLM